MIDGLLLDIDGVLVTSWEPLPGAAGALAALRRDGVGIRLLTNTTTLSCAALAGRLRDAGFDVADDEVLTAVVATATYLGHAHPGAAVFVLTDGDPREDMAGVRLVDRPEDADVVVLGGASEDFSYDAINRVFRRVMDGAALVGMHRNRFWRTARGFELDAGAYLEGLEAAAGVRAVTCGKPSAAFFEAGLERLGVPAARAAMVGDDVENDVEGARALGMRGVLVRTGKYRDGDERRGAPDAILDGLAEVPGWVRAARAS